MGTHRQSQGTHLVTYGLHYLSGPQYPSVIWRFRFHLITFWWTLPQIREEPSTLKVWILRQVDPSPPCNGGGPVGWWVEPTIFTGLDHNEGELAGHQGGPTWHHLFFDEGPHYLEEATMGLGYGHRPTCPYWSLFSVQFRGPLQWMDPLSVVHEPHYKTLTPAQTFA